MKPRLSNLLVAAVLAVAVAQAAPAEDAPAAAAGKQTDAAFFMELGYKVAAMMPDGYRAVAMLGSGKSELMSAEDAHRWLRDRNIVPASWPTAADAPLTKGRLAYMICRVLDIKGGVMMRLLGPTGRYCLFELEYLEIMVGGAEYQNVTGGELVSVIDRADVWRRSRDSKTGNILEPGQLAGVEDEKPAAQGESAEATKPAPAEAPAAPAPATAPDRKPAETAPATPAPSVRPAPKIDDDGAIEVPPEPVSAGSR